MNSPMLAPSIAWVALLASTLVVAETASAEPTSDSAGDAHSLRSEAARAFDDGDFATCQKKASEALKAAKEPQVAGLLGLCEAELHAWADAAQHLDYAMRFDPHPERVNKYRATFDDVKKHVGAIAVTTTPDGASMLLDGKDVGAAPETLFVNPGRYKLRAEKGGLVGTGEVDVTAGSERGLVLKLDASAPDDTRHTRPLWPGLTILGVGAASLGVAGGLIAVHGADLSDATTLGKGLHCDPSHLSVACQKVADKASAAQTSGDVAGGLFIAGGVGVALGGALCIWAATAPSRKPASTEKAASIAIVPVVSLRGAGLTVGGSF